MLHGELNLYVPPLTPGKYHVAILADYSVLIEGKPGKGMYYGPSRAVSNLEEFEIVPATAEWVAQTVAAARQLLSSPASKGDALARSRAVRQLRYLHASEAWQASLDLLSKAPEELLVGLTEAEDKAAVCQVMMRRLTAPQQFVTTSYLYDLKKVCGEPELPPATNSELVRRSPHVSRTEQAANDLAAHLNEKDALVKRAAVDALLGYAENRRYSGEAAPVWISMIRGKLPGPRQPNHPSLRITSPGDHAVVRPGDAIPVVVTANGFFSSVTIVGQHPLGASSIQKGPPYTFTIQVPKTGIDAGSYSLTAMGVLTSGEGVDPKRIDIEVEPVWNESDDGSSLVEDAPGITVDTGGVPVVHRPALAYPAAALARGIEGTVIIEITPDWQGRADTARVLSGPEELRVIDVSKWHFVKGVGQKPRQVKIIFDIAEARRHVDAASIPHAVPFGVPNTNLFFWRLPNPRDGCFYGSGVIRNRKLRTLDVIGIPDSARAQLMKFAPVKEGDEVGTEQMARMVSWSDHFDEDLLVWMLQTGEDYTVTVMPSGYILGVREKETQEDLANMCVLPAAAHTTDRIRMSEAAQSARLVSRVEPVYPKAMRANDVGVVRVHVIVDEHGRVLYAAPLSGKPSLIRAAVDAVRRWTYSATIVNGTPVQVITQVVLTIK